MHRSLSIVRRRGTGRGRSLRRLFGYARSHPRGRLADRLHGRLGGATAALTLLLALAAGCSDSPSEPEPTPTTELGVLVNSQDVSLTAFPLDDPSAAFTIGLAPDGSPVTLAVRGAIAVAPLGTVPAAVIVDLVQRQVVTTVALPEGSGATGAAFLNDSIVLVANPGLNTVSPINVRSGVRGDEIAVGAYPQSIVAVGDTAFVLNAELGPDFQPTGPGTVTVITGSPPAAVATIALSGTNPNAGAIGPDGRLYIVHAGRFGQSDGALSIVDRGTLEEVEDHAGFGDFPGDVAVDASGRVFVASFSYGVAVWDSGTQSFVRAPAEAITLDGVPSASGVAVDADGRLYALESNCQSASRIFLLSDAFATEDTIPTGTCPFSLEFTTVADPDA